MKIEFCCEEMMREMQGQKSLQIVLAWDARGNPRPKLKTRQWDTTHGIQQETKLCPYCGAKIEITVRKEETSDEDNK